MAIEQSVLRIEDVEIYRFNKMVLANVNIDIEQGQNYIITGPNGVGKTSLLQAIKGIVPVRSGKISFPQIKDGLYDWKRQHIKMISFADTNRTFLNKERYYQQRFHAFDSDGVTVRDYLIEQGYDETNTDHLDLVAQCGIDKLIDLSRVKLSSGQTRKLLTTIALFSKPKLLLIDNPYVGLDPANRRLFNELMDEVTSAFDIQLILSGYFEALPKCVTKAYCLSRNGDHFDFDPAIKLPTEQFAKGISPKIKSYFNQCSHWPSFESAIALDNVTVNYEDVVILDNLSWQVNRGDKWALIGGNGSGKSTLIGLIAADHPQAYKNKVKLFDKPRSHRDSIWDIKRNMGFVSSEFHAYFHDPAHSCISIVQQGLFETIYNKRPLRKFEIDVVDELFSYFEIDNIKSKSFRHCSTGEQSLVLLLRAIIKNPPLLLLDEPFQGLDDITIDKAIFLFEEVLTKEHSLVFITHFERELPDNIEKRLKL